MSNDEKVTDFLDSLEDKWEDTKAVESKGGGKDYPEVKDGKYNTKILKVCWKTPKAGGQPFLSWKLEITDGPFKGQWLWNSSNLKTAVNISFLKKDLITLGFTTEQMAKLSAIDWDILEDLAVEVTKKTNDKGYSNIYFNKTISENEAEENVKEKDVPF